MVDWILEVTIHRICVEEWGIDDNSPVISAMSTLWIGMSRMNGDDDTVGCTGYRRCGRQVLPGFLSNAV